MNKNKFNIEQTTLKNNNYRKVLNTTKTMQLVVMSLLPNEEIGMEKHIHTTQFIRIEKGHAIAYLGHIKYKLQDNDVIIVPPNTYHNIINSSKTKKLKLYTIYSPPEHKKGTIEKYKN